MIAEIRDALKGRLATIDGLRCHDTVPKQVVVPAAVVTPADPFITYDVAMGAIHDLTFSVVLVVSDAWTRTAQDALDAYIDPTGAQSVYKAFEDDPTLGGLVADVAVRSVGNYGAITWGDVQYLGCEFTVEVRP